MEVFRPININTSKGQLQIKKRINTQYKCTYFDTYETNKGETICLMNNEKQTSTKKLKNIITRLMQCTRCLTEIQNNNRSGFIHFKQKVESQTSAILIYEDLNDQRNAKCFTGKLQPFQLIDLACTLVNLVNKIKLCDGYFGSFLPHRIYQTGQQFCVIGGQFFSKKCTASEFKNQNEQLRKELSEQWRYQPPQIHNQKGQLSYFSDLFVVGCILFELITNQYPFKSKQSLVARQISAKRNMSEITKFISQRILSPLSPKERAQPSQILQTLQLQRGKVMFNTCKLPISISNQVINKPSFFNNFQQFIMKCTTQTEGWVLYYCQNSPQASQQKYLQQILTKVGKKNQKVNKIAALIEKIAQKSLQQENNIIAQQEDYSYAILKVGILVMNLSRKISLQIIQSFHSCFTKISSQIISKKPKNPIILVIFKVIAFKVTLQSKFSQLSGNFHLKVEDYMKMSIQSLDYLSQYCLKLLSYLATFADKDNYDNLKPCQNKALICLCDQLYDGVSILIFCLMAMKKDNSLKIAERQQISEASFKKLDSACSQIVNKVGRLCSSNSIFGSHQIYSVNSDYYEYQQDLCLMYCPVTTSYQYFYLDRNQYKGLTLPKDYQKVYRKEDKNQFDDFQQQQKYMNRKTMLNRRSSTKPNQIADATNIKPKLNKVAFSSINQATLDVPQPSDLTKKFSENYKSQTQKNISNPKQSNQFEAFMTDVKSKAKQKSNDSVSTNNNSNNSNVSNLKNQIDSNEANCDESWLQVEEQDILSYDWLKKTEKTICKHFQKPEVDSIIYVVYQNICKGLKLHQLIDALSKNKKVIVDPNQVLFQKVIGSGSAGEVYIGKYQQNVVAIKKVKTASNPNALKQFQREVLTYIKIKTHPCLVSLVGLTKYNQDYFLLTEFCQGGSLFDLLHKKVNEIQLSWAQRVSIALDIAKGMEFLHFMNPPVVHRDLKSLNVFMIKKNNNWAAKVADFGLSRSPQAGMMTSALGTLHWMAPQLLSNKQYSLKVDVYSFGIVLWQICCRKTPYHNIPNQMGIVKHVVLEKGRPLLELINQDCPQELINLMTKCWSQQPEERPYFPQIVAYLSNVKP